MNTSHKIQHEIEALVIGHTTFARTLAILHERIRDTLGGLLPCIEIVYGPSRVGKTELLKAILRDYPMSRIDGRREIPVLLVYIHSATSSKDLPTAVLEALEVPLPQGSISVSRLKALMFRQLKLAKVRVILFDEVSHLVEVGVHIPKRAVSDWFKDLHEIAKDMGIVINGLPRVRQLLDSNEQLRNRASKPLALMPYRYDDDEQRKAFAGCVVVFLRVFHAHGCTSSIELNQFVRHCYAASAGHIGLLAKFFLAVAKEIDGPCSLTVELCSLACKRLNLPGNGTIVPFTERVVTDTDLLTVLVSELDRYDLTLPLSSPQVQLALAKAAAVPQSIT